MDDDVRPLVEAASAGDRDAFAALYRRYRPAIYRIARTHAGDAAAEDVVADVFVRAWAAIGRYEFRGPPFSAWLYGIARHVVADTVRARARLQPVADVPERSVDPYAGADHSLELARALAELPEEQRTVVEMKYLMDLTNDDVAAALGKSRGAVNVQQWRALRALARIIGGDDA